MITIISSVMSDAPPPYPGTGAPYQGGPPPPNPAYPPAPYPPPAAQYGDPSKAGKSSFA